MSESQIVEKQQADDPADAGRARARAQPLAASLSVDAFDYLLAGEGFAVVRVLGRAGVEQASLPAASTLVLERGGALHRFAPLPDPQAVSPAGGCELAWRAEFVVPAHLVGRRVAGFKLELSAASSIGLPRLRPERASGTARRVEAAFTQPRPYLKLVAGVVTLALMPIAVTSAATGPPGTIDPATHKVVAQCPDGTLMEVPLADYAPPVPPKECAPEHMSAPPGASGRATTTTTQTSTTTTPGPSGSQPGQPATGTPAKPGSPTTPSKPGTKLGKPKTDQSKPDKQIAHKPAPAHRKPKHAKRHAKKHPAAPGPILAPLPAHQVPDVVIDTFEIPPFLLPIYQAAGIQYDVPWPVLAAINKIETNYGRNLSVSSAGAMGWMQFIPSTWRLYGVDANDDNQRDPYSPVDSIFAAARYLHAAGASHDLRGAILAYNHAGWYADQVLANAKGIGALPTDLIASLTGLTDGVMPVQGKPRYDHGLDPLEIPQVGPSGDAAMTVGSQDGRQSIEIDTARAAPFVAVNDGRIVELGHSKRRGRFVTLQDAFGNRYVYSHVSAVAPTYPVPKPKQISAAAIAQELRLPRRDAKPKLPATRGRPVALRGHKAAHRAAAAQAAPPPPPAGGHARLFAHPARDWSYAHGGRAQMLANVRAPASFARLLHLDPRDVEVRPLRLGSRVIAGTVLGRVGSKSKTAHFTFQVRPAGRGAPYIDPKPLLDGWRLSQRTDIYGARRGNPFLGRNAKLASVGQVLLMSKEALGQLVLADPRIKIYACGRRDVRSGQIDRRVLATLEFLATSGLDPTVTSLRCGHSEFTTSGNISEHASGNAVDVGAVNGTPILGHQGKGSITEKTIRRLLILQGTMKPHQIISLMTFKGADNTLSMPDHANHIHIGFHPLDGSTFGTDPQQPESILRPTQWTALMDRLGKLGNPHVSLKPSKYSLVVKRPKRAGHGRGD